jgi:hypothetical protein
VIQPQVPLRLPCYDFTPLGSSLLVPPPRLPRARGLAENSLGWCDGRCVLPRRAPRLGMGEEEPQQIVLLAPSMPAAHRLGPL